ncbi:DinB family protein [Sulfoacidibacillus thermotolerans]|uniref:Damage-inducible protein DinB n=1 Tax=Sulfoacidibacillus thermotolerans TaxID=1765684 RepID=A0A2U3D9E0_SULT2|nr:DinB family protein [Sulfoacidibacillus thermotolerans]PWI57897.1 damage-inducible protein DinB [Sulfoacidibacillus thermotolerans]
MDKEMSDLLVLYKAVHASVDQMVEGLSEQEWLQKPLPNMNNVASIIEHITLVEQRFLGFLTGKPENIDTGAPFKTDSWNVEKIKMGYSAVAQQVERALNSLTSEELDQHAAKLGIGDVNKRQLVAYLIAHTTHHRGQIPIVKKLNATLSA